MDKILVPTDFSTNSKPGLRFAIRMAARNKATLVFLHVVPLNADVQKAEEKLDSFVTKLYESMRLEPQEFETKVISGFKVDIALLDYIKQQEDLSFICISTRGASFFKKVLGTNTSNLLEKSGIPMLVVPNSYRVKPLNTVLYATDLENFEEELKVLVDFSRPRGVSIEVVHFGKSNLTETEKEVLGIDWEAKMNYPLRIEVVKRNRTQSFTTQLNKQIALKKPSLVCLFTQKEHTFFEKLFLKSNTGNVSHHPQVPLLAYNKIKKL